MTSYSMTRLAATAAAVCLAMGPAMSASGVELATGLDAASAYVFRGDTLSDGPVLQPSAEARGLKLGDVVLPLALGVWGNLDLDDHVGARQAGQFSELDLYALANVPMPLDLLGLSVAYTEYHYLNAVSSGVDANGTETVPATPSDRELTLTLALNTVLTPTLAFSEGVDGAIDGSFYGEFGLSHGFDLGGGFSARLESALGYAAPDEGDDGLKQMSATGSIGWRALSVAVTGIASLDSDVLKDADDGGLYDERVVAMLSLAHVF
ncbi:MAG: hypothetical protein PHR35_14715 [Kiritimatiellae bacterium]|nr:hypothetical protein [Kiritimatiellia bacterium]